LSLFNEVKRRNVLRVGAAYIVAAWLIIQVVETIFPAFGFGDTAVRIVVILLAVGFILVLILAWVFEITPEGLRKEKDVDRSQSIALQTGKILDRIIIIVLALALSYFAIDKFILDPARDTARELAAKEKGRTEALVESYGDQSVAVFPFVNMSSDPEQEYFSDGIAEELLNLLARVPELRVISRSSSFSFKGQDISIPEIADRLNVAHILVGSVRTSGNTVRITAQLIEARSDTHLWSQTYDRTLDDLFAIQDEIAADVVLKLRGSLLADLPPTARTDPEAHRLLLQASYISSSGGGEDSIRKALALLEQAYAIDPEYLPGVLGLVEAVYSLMIFGSYDPAEAKPRLIELMAQAAAIDPDDPQFLALSAFALINIERDYERAAAMLERAVRIAPGDARVLGIAAAFAWEAGRFDTAILLIDRTLELDPLCFTCVLYLARTNLYAGQLDESLKNFQAYRRLGRGGAQSFGILQLLRGEPEAALASFVGDGANSYQINAGRAMALHDLGRPDEARAAFEEQMQQFPGAEAEIAKIYAWQGDIDNAIVWLYRAFSDDTHRFLGEVHNPVWSNLHSDPRWHALREKAGISAERFAALQFNPELPP